MRFLHEGREKSFDFCGKWVFTTGKRNEIRPNAAENRQKEQKP